ncbi:MAG: helix-turn-helix domain-containing protein [bacterium]|nr:helix-turn-helix domain-containing protein [bacterium]
MEPTSQTISFCDELRKAREYQGLSLAEIAHQTFIPKEYLEALEDGKLDIIPQPIQRGVISAYARAARMNSEKVLRTLEELQGIRPKSESSFLSLIAPPVKV